MIYRALDVRCWSPQSSTSFLYVLVIYSVEFFGWCWDFPKDVEEFGFSDLQSVCEPLMLHRLYINASKMISLRLNINPL